MDLHDSELSDLLSIQISFVKLHRNVAEKHALPYRFFDETQLKTKKCMLERHGIQLKASVLGQEIALQA
jgi:hypothetical protein